MAYFSQNCKLTDYLVQGKKESVVLKCVCVFLCMPSITFAKQELSVSIYSWVCYIIATKASVKSIYKKCMHTDSFTEKTKELIIKLSELRITSLVNGF